MINKNLKEIIDCQILEYKNLKDPSIDDTNKFNILFSIKDNKVEVSSKEPAYDKFRLDTVENLIKGLDLNGVECKFLLHTEDISYGYQETERINTGVLESTKTLCFTKKRHQKFVTIPNLHILIGGVHGYLNQVKMTDVEYENKINKSFFCGCPSGRIRDNLGKRIEYLSATRYNRLADNHYCILNNIATHSIQSQLSFKYLLNIDGETSSFDRIYWTLFSNSLVWYLDRDFSNVELYQELLKPWEHYVPVTIENIQNVFNRYETGDLNNHRDIIVNAKKFIIEYFLTEDNSYKNILNYIIKEIGK